MAYSRNPSTARKLEPQLRPLLEGKPVRWCVGYQTQAWAYKVREAVYIIQHHESEFPEYAAVAPHIIVAVSHDTVTARVERPHNPIPYAAVPLPPITVPSVKTLPEVVTFFVNQWTANGQTVDNVYVFPMAVLDGQQLQTLQNYLAASKLRMRVTVREPLTIEPFHEV